jgi:hypothetical protein
VKRRKPLKRKAVLRPKTANPRRIGRSPVKRVNQPRKDKEFARTYFSAERVAWMKAQPCGFCYSGPSDCAHLPSHAGMGRKGDYTTTIALCRRHHEWFDQQPAEYRNQDTFRGWAWEYERAWTVYAKAHGLT